MPRFSSGARDDGGFTILELMVTLAMIGILLAFLSLNASDFLSHHRLGNAARQVASDLRLARTKATEQGVWFQIVFTVGPTYIVRRSTDGGTTWDEHALYGKAATAAAPRPIHLPAPVETTTAVTLVFGPRGNVWAPGTVRLRDSTGGTHAVTVSFAGQVTIG